MMLEMPTISDQEREPVTRRSTFWGCGGLLAGLLIGALVMALGLIVLAPRPQAAAPGSGGTAGNLSITMDDTYLTQIVSSSISQASLPIHVTNVQVEIQPANQVKISGIASSTLPVGAQLTAVAQVRVQSGHLALHILSAHVGGLPLPANVTTALEQPMNSKLAEVTSALLPPGFVITGISTTEHHLQMTISQG